VEPKVQNKNKLADTAHGLHSWRRQDLDRPVRMKKSTRTNPAAPNSKMENEIPESHYTRQRHSLNKNLPGADLRQKSERRTPTRKIRPAPGSSTTQSTNSSHEVQEQIFQLKTNTIYTQRRSPPSLPQFDWNEN
jgi:hypothetical protein